MNVLIINCILYTSFDCDVIPKRSSISDCMICNLARAFVELGHSVTLLASADYKPTNNEKQEFNIIYFESKLASVFNPKVLPYPKGLFKYLKNNSENFDIVISSEVFSIASLISARTCPEKLLIWQELDLFQHKFFQLPAKFWHYIAVPLFMRNVKVVARSSQAKKFISQFNDNVSPEIVDHGMDGNKFYPSNETNDYFIVVSRLLPLKCIDKIIYTFAQFISNNSYSHYKLKIIGYGSEYERLTQLAQNLGIEYNIEFCGFLDHNEMAEHLRHAKALLISTKHDLNMISITESITCGTPIVTTSIPLTSAIIKQREFGIVDDDWNEKTLELLIRNYKKYKTNCILAHDEYTSVNCAKRLINAFEKFN